MPIAKITGQPYQEPLIAVGLQPGGGSKPTGTMAAKWIQFMTGLIDRVEKVDRVIKALRLQTQAASIPTTAFELPSLDPGLYRVSYYARITRPATLSSSLSVTLGWTDGAVACVLPTGSQSPEWDFGGSLQVYEDTAGAGVWTDLPDGWIKEVSGGGAVALEINARAQDATAVTITCRVFDVTANAPVAGSEATVVNPGNTSTRAVSLAFVLPASRYTVQMRRSVATVGVAAKARVYVAGLVGNVTTAVQMGSVLMRIDQATTITYATTYASSGATPMQYSVDFVVESVPAN